MVATWLISSFQAKRLRGYREEGEFWTGNYESLSKCARMKIFQAKRHLELQRKRGNKKDLQAKSSLKLMKGFGRRAPKSNI
jgi:hypothetical protein